METTTEEKAQDVIENHSSENNEKSISPPPQDLKKSKKEDRSKKEDKSVEQFMKSLNTVPSIEEKLSMVCKKYVQTADENRKLQFYIKQSDKRYALLLKEKEQLQHEFNKTILVKSKLENLCRELQKQNKAIKEESLLKIREEEERRKETQAKFQNTLSEITTLLQQNTEQNAKLRDDNISMSEKFKSVVQQYQLREQQVEKMSKQMALESQLADAKLQKASLEHRADKERFKAEIETLKVTVAQGRAKIVEQQGTESNLRAQLAVYMDKYDEFQNALVKSNSLFGGFKEQMENMSKKIKKLEKESLSWKKRWETSQTALLDMCGERQDSEERAASTGRQLHQMQTLCRTLQAERNVLLSTLKEHNIERPPLPAVPPAPAPPAPPLAVTTNDNKVEAMAANCAQLRQSLANLQTQLNVLSIKNVNKEENTKPEKSKKSRSKKSKLDKQGQSTAEDNIRVTTESENIEVKQSDDSKESTPNEDTLDTKGVSEVENKVEESVLTEIEVDSKNDDAKNLEDKVDDKTLENLIQAINNANINLCDLKVIDKVDDDETELKNENNNLINALKDISNEVTPVDCKKDDVNNIPKDVDVEVAKVTNVELVSNQNVEPVKTNDITKIEQISNQIVENVNQSDELPHIDEVKSVSLDA